MSPAPPHPRARDRIARRLGARLRGESGMAMPIAITMLLVVLMLTSVTVTYAIHSVDRSNQDRAAARALAAADAGLDVAEYRMSKTLVTANAVNGIQGLLGGALGSLTCLDATAANLVELGGGNWCSLGASERVEGLGAGEGASFTYYTDFNLTAAGGGIPGLLFTVAGSGAGSLQELLDELATVGRDVVSVGEAADATARVKGTYQLDIPSLTFRRTSYVQCPSEGWGPEQPDADCAG